MSKAFIEKVLTEFAKDSVYKHKKTRVVIRKHYKGSYPHVYQISQDDLRTTFRYNALSGLFRNMANETTAIDENQKGKINDVVVRIAEEIVQLIYKNKEGFKSWYRLHVRNIPDDQFVLNEGDFVLVLREGGVKSDWDTKTKLAKFALEHFKKDSEMKKLIKSHNKSEESEEKGEEEFGKRFMRRTQVLHETVTTTGSFRFINFFDRLLKPALGSAVNEALGKGGAAGLISVLKEDELFKELIIHWNKKSKDKQFELNDETKVRITVGPGYLNPAGSEGKYDWGRVKGIEERLSQVIMKYAKDQGLAEKLATSEGSKSFAQRTQERAITNIIKAIALKAHGKVVTKKGFKEEKGKSYRWKRNQIRKANKHKKRRVGRKSGVALKTVASRKTQGSPMNLIALLNAQLPKEVMDNMSPPSLENRTGRFAQSVRALKVVKKGGIQNITYTYDHDPYQVFELSGRGDKRWATKARDPRNIINKSIREVATKMMMGRFTTTRI